MTCVRVGAGDDSASVQGALHVCAIWSLKDWADKLIVFLQTAERENNPRGINRHKFSIEEAEEALQQPVVQALLDLCKFRNTHPAFNGKVCARFSLHTHQNILYRRHFLVSGVRSGCVPSMLQA